MADRILADWRVRPFARILTIEHAAGHPLPVGTETLDFGDTRVTVWRA